MQVAINIAQPLAALATSHVVAELSVVVCT